MSNRSEQEIRQSIEESRARMGDTVEEIGARVNPDRVQRELKARARDEVDEFKSNVKRKARSTMSNLEHGAEEKGRGMWRTIKDNPVPATMVGVGLAWLMANGNKSDHYGYGGGRVSGRGPAESYGPGYPRADYPPQHDYRDDVEPGARERAEELTDEVRDRGAEAMETAREKTSELSQKGREQARHARHRAEEWSDRAQYKARRAEHRVEDAVRDNPLAAGAMAAALGLAAGLMVPETQREREMLGPTRDRVLDRAQRSAMGAADKARESVKETAGEAARKAVDGVFPGGDRERTGGREDAMTEPGRE